MYPDVSQMYLTCSVTFQENTCISILTFCMYFTRWSQEERLGSLPPLLEYRAQRTPVEESDATERRMRCTCTRQEQDMMH